MLTIDSDAMMKAFLNRFQYFLKAALVCWKEDVMKYSSNYIKELSTSNFAPKADFKMVVDLSGKMITVFFQANGTLLADIYGTGSEMIEMAKLPEVFNDYWNNRGSTPSHVNPSRRTYAIEGRPKGTYYDIFGNKHESKGTMEGKIIEGGDIQPIEPNDELYKKYFGTALEIADKFFRTTYLNNAVKNTIQGMDLSQYIKEVK